MQFDVMITGLDKAILNVKRLPKSIEKAQKRALKRSMSSFETSMRRDVSRRTGIAQMHLKRYQRIKTDYRYFRDYVYAKFWLGTNPMPADAAKGSARDDWLGVTKGGYFHRGAFYADVYGGGRKIWFRKNSKFAAQNVFYHRKRSRSKTSVFSQENSGRFPVVLAGINIAPQAEQAFKWQRQKIESTLRKRLVHELNYEVSKWR